MDPSFFGITDSVSLMKQRKENKDRRLALWRAARREDYFEDSYDSMYSYTSNHGAFHTPIRCENSVSVRSPEKKAFHKNEYDKYHIPPGDDTSMFASSHGGYASPMRPNIERKIDFNDAKIDNQLKGVRKMQPLQPIPREIEVNMDSRSIGIPRKNKGDEEQIKPLQTHALFDDSNNSSDSSHMNIVSNEKTNPIFSCLKKKKRKVDHDFLPFGRDIDLE
ncbi:predicted protein [Chaetoceros tenuissimus]|uniref:Uncharacterized protein n=1 Tax=Chaetoceros tenuissimus TaxID=426638 RepID=A0AAD3H4L1_9STRA|nr:predicted protein [Chaetoceros tenuissimus]